MPSHRPKGYVALLKSNPDFRNLWYGQIVSELGDWLNSIAIFTLVLKISGTGTAMAAVMMAKLFPIVVISPLAGALVDRWDKKHIMIAADLARFFVVLGFLWVMEGGSLWVLYGLVILETALAGFFEPARSAIIPSITPRKDLVAANALAGATWSAMLAFGAAAGGLLVAWFGVRAAFLIDAFTFLLSCWFITRIRFSESKKASSGKPFRSEIAGQALDGFRYVFSEPIILALALLKSGLALAGGIMTLIPLYANKIIGASASLSLSLGIGLMYAARGVGAGLGPLLANKLFGDSARALQNSIAGSFFLGAVCYWFFAESQSILTASLSLGAATLFGSIIWVFSSALIHLEADKRYLGRIFSSELALLTLTMGVGNWGVGFATDQLGWSPDQAARAIAVIFIAPGVSWVLFLAFLRRRLSQGKCVGSHCPVDPSGFNPAPSNPLREGILVQEDEAVPKK